MKRKLLYSLCLLALSQALHAGSLTFYNLTGNYVFIAQLEGRNSPTNPPGDFAVGDVVVAPGVTTYADPTTVTGIPSVALPSGFFTAMHLQCTPVFASIGSPTFTTLPQQAAIPTGSDCNGGVAFDVSWNEGGSPTYNVVVLMWP